MEQHTLSLGGIALPLTASVSEVVDQVTQQVKLSPIRFSFEFRQIRFSCSCEELADGSVWLKVGGRIGVLPFSAESPTGRVRVAQIVRGAERELGNVISISGGYVLSHYSTTLTKPVSATSLISALIVHLAQLTPYLALLGEIIEFPMAQLTRKSAIRPKYRNR